MLGIAGLVGSGRTELARLIYGADPKAGGEVLLERPAGRHQAGPRTRSTCGLAYLTEDRKRLGLFLDMSCGENINVGVIDRDAARLRRPRTSPPPSAGPRQAFKALRVRAASPLVTVGSLSGGNQQKVLLSRWLEIGPKVLILDEPTRGVDIGAKSEIYRIIDELAKKRHRRDRDLQRAAGDHRHLRPRAGDARGAHRGRGRRPERQADHPGEHHGAGGRRGGLSGRRPEQRGGANDGERRRLRPRRPAASGGAGLSARQVQMRGMIAGARHAAGADHPRASASTTCRDGRFFTPQNISIVAQQASINTVLAAGMTFVILTGGIDLSVGSILAASAMAALIVSLIPGWGLLGIPAGLITGLFFGFLNGALIAFVGLPPFIVTLGSLTAVRGIARLMGGDTTVFNPDLPFAFIGNASLLRRVPWLAIIALIVIVASWFVLRRTVLGVRIYAVGGNPAAARLSGIKVWAILLFVYCLSGLLVGPRRGDVGRPALRRQRPADRPGLRARRHRGGDPGRHQLRRRHRLDLGHADRGPDHRRAHQRPDPDSASPTSGSSSSRAW